MRRKTFEKLEMREKWRGTLSDDFAVTRALKKAGLPICFVPQALTASVENCSFRELLEFTTQADENHAGLRAAPLEAIVSRLVYFQSGFSLGNFDYRFEFNRYVFILVRAASLILISAFSTGKARLRLKAVKLILKDYEKELNKQFWTQNTLWIFSPALFFYNSIVALFSRKICLARHRLRVKIAR